MINELPRVLGLIRDAEGADAALAAGEDALSYTDATGVLEALVALADAAGQSDRAQPWRAKLQERAAAAEVAREAAGERPTERGKR